MTTTPPTPTLTAATNADPCPRVEVLITPMPGDIDEITIYRSWSGRRSVVRGASRSPVAGAYLVVDYEVPLGVQVAYSAVGYDVAGTPSLESSTATVTVSVSDVWIQDPLDPTSALPVALSRPATTGLSLIGDSIMPAAYSLPTSESTIVGSAEPVGFAGLRQAPSQMPLQIIAWSASDASNLRELLMQAFPLCLRTPSALPQLGGLSYLSLPDVTEIPYPGWAATLFSTSGKSIRGPGAGIVVQPRTYAELPGEASTYAGLLPLYATYLDLLRGL